MDDLGQIIFVVLFILGLISSSKKKKKGTRAPQVPQDATPPAGEVPSRSRVQELPAAEVDPAPLPEAPGYADEMVRPKRALAEELLLMLQGQEEPESEPVVTLPEVDDEAQSLETLEPAQSPYLLEETPQTRPYASQDTLAERPYLVEETTTPRPYAIHDVSERRKHLTRSELRHAFVMKEVLGPPKALEE